jgi:hypothetical protein
MDQRGDEVHTSSTEATGASREGVVRWVLLIGTLLAIALLTIIWISGAFSQDEDDVHQNVGREIQAQQAESATDQGAPVMPAVGESGSPSAASAPPSDGQATSSPTPAATPGDAPAGDPKQDSQ